MKNNGLITRQTRVKNDLGMHARPASQIAQMAEQAAAGIWLNANQNKVDATSIIDILTLNAVKDTNVVVEIENDLDKKILDQIVEFFEDGFGEL